jgi:hypothetical protein
VEITLAECERKMGAAVDRIMDAAKHGADVAAGFAPALKLVRPN